MMTLTSGSGVAVSDIFVPLARRGRARAGDEIAQKWRGHGEFMDLNAQGMQRVVDRAGDAGGPAQIARFARTFLAEGGEGRGRAVIDDLDVGDLVGRGQEIVHEGAADELTAVVVAEAFVKRGADAMRDAAIGH